MKILLVEDDTRIVRVLNIRLKKENYQVNVASDGKEALEMFKNDNYSMILLDLMLPKLSGREVCKEIRRESNIPIIILTAKNELLTKIELLDIGADDYLTKPFELEELLARMRVLFRNKKNYLENIILRYKEIEIHVNRRKIYVNKKEEKLTKKEYELLEYLIKNKRIVLDRDKIITDIWGWDYEGNLKIIDIYINSLRKKIPNCIKYIKSVYGVGYIFGDE